MREFNIEAALAGHPVQTRDGRPVAQLVKFDFSFGPVRLAGVIDDHRVGVWLADGLDCTFGDSQSDLLMAPVKKTGWIARYGYPHCSKSYVAGVIFGSEEDVEEAEPDASSYHEISWEEEWTLKNTTGAAA
jgi:hypothetical protein